MRSLRILLTGAVVWSFGLTLALAQTAPEGGTATPVPSPTAQGAPSAPPAGSSGAVAPDSSRSLGVGDQVTFEIVEDKAAPLSKRITDTGELDVPYIGRVRASGKTCEQVAAEIKRRLEADYYFKATVKLGIDLVNVKPSGPMTMGKVYVSGQVRAPGPQEMMPGEKTSVSAVIMKAGGCTQFGDSRKVKVTRKVKGGGTESFVVDIKGVLERGELDQDRDVREGDYIYVPQKLINW